MILGSGAVGVEFASIFRRFGSEVTIVELLPRLVPVEDEAVSAELEKSFKTAGHQGPDRDEGAPTRARPGTAGVEIDAQTPDGTSLRLSAEYLLVATGRGPVTTGLGAEEAGLRLERGYVHVNTRFETGVPGISAIGDVITFDKPGHPQLAHLSSAEGVALAERIAGQDFRPINYDQVPGCTYCDPEIGSVGLTEREARERGYDVRIGTFKFGVLGPRQDRQRDRRLRQDRRRPEVRRDPRRPHDRSARDRARRRGDACRAPRMHGRRTDSHDPRAPDDVGGGG